MIEVEHLDRRFGAHLALSDLSFTVRRGEIAGLLGPNGAGKTTVQRILMGALAPTRGRVSVAGFDALRAPLDVRRRVGYLPEVLPLYPELRVEEFLRFRARLKGIGARNVRAACDEVLDRCGLQTMRRRLIGALSRGYRLRVGLADALLADPEVLILDEPTAGLDPLQRRELLSTIRAWRGEKTVLLSSHILPEIEATCDRILLLHEGRLLADGAPAELAREAAGVVHLRLLAADLKRTVDWKRIDGITGHVGRPLANDRFELDLEVAPDAAVETALLEAVHAAGGRVLRLAETKPSLDELFVRIVRENRALITPREISAADAAVLPVPRRRSILAPLALTRPLRAIIGRELGSYIRSPLGPVLFALTQSVIGWTLYDHIVTNPDATVRGQAREMVLMAFGGGAELSRLWFFILPPLLSMRLFAEERRMGTLEGLLTAPVRIATLVLAKFSAAWLFFALLFAPGWLYLAAASALGAPIDVGLACSQYLALLALGTIGLAAGTFCSVLASNQVTAAAAAFTLNLVLALPSLLRTFLDLDRWSAVLTRFDLFSVWESGLRRGLLDSAHSVLFISLTALFLTWSVLGLEARRWR